MGELDAVIFDVDGTLVDSVDLHARCWRRALARYGKEVVFPDVRRQIGKGSDQFLPVFLTESEIAAFGKELEDHRARIWRWYASRVAAFPKVRELFATLRADGIRVAVGSSSKKPELLEFLERANVDDLCDVIVSRDDAEESKPQPDVFQAALKKLDVPPSRALVVGDTPWDAIAATRAGLETIGVLCGGWDADELKRAGCFAVYHDPEDLLRRYEDSPFKRLWMYRAGTPLAEMHP